MRNEHAFVILKEIIPTLLSKFSVISNIRAGESELRQKLHSFNDMEFQLYAGKNLSSIENYPSSMKPIEFYMDTGKVQVTKSGVLLMPSTLECFEEDICFFSQHALKRNTCSKLSFSKTWPVI